MELVPGPRRRCSTEHAPTGGRRSDHAMELVKGLFETQLQIFMWNPLGATRLRARRRDGSAKGHAGRGALVLRSHFVPSSPLCAVGRGALVTDPSSPLHVFSRNCFSLSYIIDYAYAGVTKCIIVLGCY